MTPRQAPLIVLNRDLPVSFRPSIERLAAFFENGSGFFLCRAASEVSAVCVMVKHVPILRSYSVRNITEDQVNGFGVNLLQALNGIP